MSHNDVFRKYGEFHLVYRSNFKDIRKLDLKTCIYVS